MAGPDHQSTSVVHAHQSADYALPFQARPTTRLILAAAASAFPAAIS